MGVILLPGAVFPIAVFCPVAIFAVAIPVIAVAIASTSSGGSSVDDIARKLRPLPETLCMASATWFRAKLS